MSPKQRVYLFWLFNQYAWLALSKCKTQADYTRVKDKVRNALMSSGGKYEPKSIEAMGLDILSMVVQEANSVLGDARRS